MTPALAVSLWPDLEAAAKAYNIPLGSASCSTCASCAAGPCRAYICSWHPALLCCNTTVRRMTTHSGSVCICKGVHVDRWGRPFSGGTISLRSVQHAEWTSWQSTFVSAKLLKASLHHICVVLLCLSVRIQHMPTFYCGAQMLAQWQV